VQDGTTAIVTGIRSCFVLRSFFFGGTVIPWPAVRS